jgi:hypothetical protein
MGFTGLARWVNSPAVGLDLISENITKNHQGIPVGKWQLSVRSYRSTFAQNTGFDIPTERLMFSLTMNDNVFVLLEDPLAPSRGELLSMPPGQNLPPPSHYRTTFLTLK